jgi:polynucleotide 5'-hydroxyl-kinase GRC3/NOL9
MSAGKVQMVRGPALVHATGRCTVLGMHAAGEVRVRAGKVLPFESEDGCTLDVQGESWVADPKSAGTSMWEQAAGRALFKNATVMIAGATDTGKSTFATYLANLALGQGFTVSIIDADIGQGDLAPPAALGAAAMKNQTADLRDVRADLFGFVGTMTPAGSEPIIARKLKSLVDRMPAGIKIVNTDGYAEPSYKRLLARTVRPDVVVCMGKSDLVPALACPWELVEAPSSGQAVKTRAERVGRRLDRYTAHVADGLAIKPAEQLRVKYQDRPVRWQDFLALFPAGMFVALGSRGRVAGFGIVESADSNTIIVRTGVQGFGTVHASDILLADGREERITTQMRGL